MSTIQNLKNFIRHGKQAKAVNNAHADPTTSVSPVHAQQQRHQQPAPRQPQHFGVSEPVVDHKPLQHHQEPPKEYSAANVDQRNVAAQAGGVAAQKAGEPQKLNQGGTKERKKDFDPTALERIIAEEREASGKFPKYPGLERFKLLEKMGDGAFSNVYRARDLTGEFEEVAIKVVRKYEMNSGQVSKSLPLRRGFSLPSHRPVTQHCVLNGGNVLSDHLPIYSHARAINTSTPTSRSNPRL